MKTSFGRILAATAALALSISCVRAAIADEPLDAYHQMLTKLKSVRTYQVTIQETTELQPTDPSAKPRSITSTDDVIFEQPNRFSFINDGLMGGVTIISDGKTQYIYSSMTQEYASRPAPTDVLSSVLGQMQGGTAHWNPATTTVIDGVPVKRVDGTVSSSRGIANVTLYIRKSDSLPFEAIMHLPTVSGSTGDGVKITRTELFTNQKVNAPVPTSAFSFVPPMGSTKVNSVNDLGGGFGGMSSG